MDGNGPFFNYLFRWRGNPTISTFANVTGTASFPGTVYAAFASGSYLAMQYTILRSTAGAIRNGRQRTTENARCR